MGTILTNPPLCKSSTEFYASTLYYLTDNTHKICTNHHFTGTTQTLIAATPSRHTC